MSRRPKLWAFMIDLHRLRFLIQRFTPAERNYRNLSYLIILIHIQLTVARKLLYGLNGRVRELNSYVTCASRVYYFAIFVRWSFFF